jgi:hypothetical protein
VAATKASKKKAGKKKAGKSDKKGKTQAVWEKENPKARHQKMTPKQKAKAKKAAKRQGRSTPSLVDNINAQKGEKQR